MEQHSSRSAPLRRQTGARVRAYEARPATKGEYLCRKALRVRLFMGPKERGAGEGRGTESAADINETVREYDSRRLRPGQAPGWPVSVGGRFQRGIALPTNANMPSSFCLYLSQNHSFPVCFLVTVTITSFKNSLPYIIRQTVPNLCFGPDALTAKLSAHWVLIFFQGN